MALSRGPFVLLPLYAHACDIGRGWKEDLAAGWMDVWAYIHDFPSETLFLSSHYTTRQRGGGQPRLGHSHGPFSVVSDKTQKVVKQLITPRDH
jgi:hypothetical protein